MIVGGQGFVLVDDSSEDSPPFFATSARWKRRFNVGWCNGVYGAAESRKARVTLTLAACTLLDTLPSHWPAWTGLSPISILVGWHKGCRTSSLIAKRLAVLISTRIFKRRGINEGPNRSPGSSSSSPHSSTSALLASPPTSMLIGSASQCSSANRGQWGIACSGVSHFSGKEQT